MTEAQKKRSFYCFTNYSSKSILLISSFALRGPLFFVLFFFFLPNSLSVSYACGSITPIQRVDSSERHCFYYDFTTILFCIFFCLFFLFVFVFSSCGIVLVFNTRCCFSIARCQNCLKNLINEILQLSCHQLSSSSLSLSDLVLKASS